MDERGLVNLIFNCVLYELADAPAKHKGGRKDNVENSQGTMLSEDYAEIVDEEGDYSTPASKFVVFIFFCCNI